MKPKILIVASDGYAKNIPHFMINLKYGEAISRAGGLPFVALNTRCVDDYLDMADGVLLTDGAELHAGRYGEFYSPEEAMPPLEREREAMEWRICEICKKRGMPVFGIGRGMHILNVFTGGSLTRHMQGEKNHVVRDGGKTEFLNHTVSVTLDTFIAYDPFKTEVNSAHSQCLKFLGDGIRVVAVAEDGVAEALEHKTLPWFGVQWHPELMEGVCGDKLFEHFIKVAKE